MIRPGSSTVRWKLPLPETSVRSPKMRWTDLGTKIPPSGCRCARSFCPALTAGDAWLEKGANILVFGPPGTGKSHLGSAIGHALIDNGFRVLFSRTGDLVQRLQAARRDLQLPAALAKLDKFDLLILNDISYVRKDQAETSVLFELIAERYERLYAEAACHAMARHGGPVWTDEALRGCVAVLRNRTDDEAFEALAAGLLEEVTA